MSATPILIASIIGGVFICTLTSLCGCLCYFWTKNRRLMNKKQSLIKAPQRHIPQEQQPLNAHIDTNDIINNQSHRTDTLVHIASQPDLVIENTAKQTMYCKHCQANFTTIEKIQSCEYLIRYWSRKLKNPLYIPLDIFQLILEFIECNKLQSIDSRTISFEYEVGRGTFGKVFRACWTYSGKQKTVACKWFRQDNINEPAFTDFIHELSIAAHLSPHDNVLKIYGFITSPYALITEYMNGGSVEKFVSTSNNMRSNVTIGDCVQILLDAARGLSHLHSMNIIHRDVAARNLLIEDFSITRKQNDRKRRVVVCDFVKESRNFINHMGPVKWMSPECIKQLIYNEKTDVYSFGILMWEILCGMPPYPSTKVLSLAVEVISKQTRPYVLSWFPRPLKILMQRCWQEIPEWRPTFEDIISELEMFKYELGKNKVQNQLLITISANQLTEMNKTKEKLRTLMDIVEHYLHSDKYAWDAMIEPKLRQLISEWV